MAIQINEKDLEDLIYEDIQRGCPTLHEIGLDIPMMFHSLLNRAYWFRQLNLGPYGIADLVGVTRANGSLYVNLVELKNVPITSKDFNQVFRYEAGIREMVNNSFKSQQRLFINPYLVGPSIEDGHYIQNETDLIIYTFNYGLNGFRFQKHSNGWFKGKGDSLVFGEATWSEWSIILPESYYNKTNG